MNVISGAEKRKQLFDNLILAGWPEATANECVDLAFHACDEALATMLRVCETSNIQVVEFQATLLASELIVGKLEMTLQQVEKDTLLASMEDLIQGRTTADAILEARKGER